MTQAEIEIRIPRKLLMAVGLSVAVAGGIVAGKTVFSEQGDEVGTRLPPPGESLPISDPNAVWNPDSSALATARPSLRATPTIKPSPFRTNEASPLASAQSTESGIEDVTSSLGYKFTRPKDWATVDNDGTYFLYAPGNSGAPSPDAIIGLANFTGNAEKTVRDLQNAGLVEDAPVPFTNRYGTKFTVLSYGDRGKVFANLAITEQDGKPYPYTITVYSPYYDTDKRALNRQAFELFIENFEFLNGDSSSVAQPSAAASTAVETEPLVIIHEDQQFAFEYPSGWNSKDESGKDSDGDSYRSIRISKDKDNYDLGTITVFTTHSGLYGIDEIFEVYRQGLINRGIKITKEIELRRGNFGNLDEVAIWNDAYIWEFEAEENGKVLYRISYVGKSYSDAILIEGLSYPVHKYELKKVAEGVADSFVWD